MPLYHTSVINKDFSSSDEMEFTTLEDARAQAMKAALDIGSDEIVRGKSFFGAEITIRQDNMIVDRVMVSIGHTPLKL
jgi:hypothetical protein